MAVAEYLDFHMSWLHHGALQDQLVAAECTFRFLAGAFQLGGNLAGIGDHAHAAAAPPGAGLDHQRQADAFGFLQQSGVALVFAFVAGNAGDTRFNHGQLGQALGAHQVNGIFVRADKGNAGVLARPGKAGIFGKKAIARMHRIGTGLAAGIEQGIHVQIGRAGQGRPNTHRFVRQLYMTGTGIRFGIDRHGPVAQGLGGGDDPASNLATVGNQDFFKAHCGSLPVFRLKILSRRSGASGHEQLRSEVRETGCEIQKRSRCL